ncbi:MAG TPA: serine hydrolase domain-containing protein [Pyrinomonadaceae bacterium]|jgi:CubicO group peptidase (beta-lactamase class C family)
MRMNLIRSNRFLALLALYLLAVQFTVGQAPTAKKSSLDTFIEKKMNESGMVGLGAAIIVNKKLVWTKGYGYADRDNKTLFNPNTIMNIGSISKTFTGAALMRAVEDKKVSLDEDINNYLPFKVINPFFPNERITLRNLATHTSGITDRAAIYKNTYHYGGDSPESLGEFLKNYFEASGKYYSKDNFLKHKSGSYREYSNIAAALAGYIVEISTGKKLNAYSKRYIFKPLKMDDTGWFFSEVKLANHSKLYGKQGDAIKPVQLYGLTTYPDGGVRTSVSDLSKFFICLLNSGEYKGVRILKRQSAEEMLKFQYSRLNKPENIELTETNSGIFWATKSGTTRIGHGGGDPGVKTEMQYDPAKEVGVILFTNTGLSDEAMFKDYFAIFDELWTHALSLKDAETKDVKAIDRRRKP